MKTRYRGTAYLILGIFVAAVMYLSIYHPAFADFSSPQKLREQIIDWEGAGLLLFSFLVAFSVVLPLPSSPLIIAGGYVYGALLAAVLAIGGAIVGGWMAFKLVRAFGRPVLDRFVDPKHTAHFYHIFRKRGASAVLLFYAIPIFPSDTVSFLLGLTRMRTKTFLLLISTGSVPRLVLLALFGQSLSEGITPQTIIIGVCIAVFLAGALFRDRLRRYVAKEARVVEGEIESLLREL